MSQTQSSFLRLAAVLGVCLVVRQAHAVDDDKGAPGTICRVADLSSQTAVTYTSDGKIAAQSSIDVVCPLLTDSTGNPDGLADMEAFVTPAAGSINCTIHCMSATGVSQDTENRSSSGTSAQTLDWGSFSLDCDTNGTYALTCELDSGDVINAIRWVENG